MAEKRVTLRDVAAAAGVSRATAGFVLSDAPGISISAATRQRVRETAQGLGYVPHSIARALREGSSRVIVLSIDSGDQGNYLRTFTQGLDEELAAHDYVLLVRHGHSAPGSQQRLIEAISPRAVLRMPDYLASGHEFDDGGWHGGLAGNVEVQLQYLACAATPGSPSRYRRAIRRWDRFGCGSPARRQPGSGCPRRCPSPCRGTAAAALARSGRSSMPTRR